MDVDLKVLNATWQHIIQRHQSLRTFFIEARETSASHLLDCVVLRELPKPEQVVSEDFICTTLQDVRKDLKLPHTDGTLDYGHQIKAYSGLDPSTLKALNGRRLCMIEIPHMVVDGASLCILLEEMRQGLLSNSTIFQSLPLPTQYESYIEYLQNLREGEDAALDYWADYLAGSVPCQFPSMCPPVGDRPYNEANSSSPPAASGSDNTIHLSVSYSDLRAFCRGQNATISNAIQAAWAILLFTYTGSSDVCFGYLSSGRNVPIRGATTIVGPMMSMLVSRVNSIGALSIKDIVKKMRDDFVSSLPHQALPLHRVQSLLGLGQTSLFNTIVTSYYAPLMLLDDDGEQNPVSLLESHNASNFDLVVKAVYSDNDIRIRLVYSASALSAHAAKGIAKTFESTLHNMTMASGVDSETVAAIDILSPRDLAVISDWNRTSFEAFDRRTMAPGCVHDLISYRAKLQPLAPAICAWDGSMDYQTLDRVSTDVARQICSMGIGPGAFVPLCFEKSIWFPVALLSVLKSGNAFVPFDLSNPSARISKMMNTLTCSRQADGVLPLILCSRTQHSRCSTFARELLIIDATCAEQIRPSGQLFGAMEKSPLPCVPSSNPAYIIFTSGSSGVPKGVIVEHKSYAFAAQAHQSGLRLDETSRVLQFASYGFDTSIEDHLSTLISGACLCIPSEVDRLDLDALADFVKTSQANWAHLTPSLADAFTPNDMPSIKTMVLGGEPMTARNVATWAESSIDSTIPGDRKLIQVYGPSECCVTSSIHSPVPLGSPGMDIGTAVPGCGLWITREDNAHFLCPVGVAGELLVEGPILARGYLGQPDLEALAFVQGLSWTSDKTRRFYRTGDVARFIYDSDGHIRLHFVGRKDRQVKINGQRIELGEIERTLALQSQIRQSLVTVPKMGPFENQLVGFISFVGLETAPEMAEPSTACSSGGHLSGIKLLGGSWRSHVRDVVDFLQDSLPPYMVPEIFICVEEIPKNTSGKLDMMRAQRYVEELETSEYHDLISRIGEGQDQHQDDYRAGTEIEYKLRTLWSETLRVPESQILWDTSFFFLGGDSISAMMISQAARQKGVLVTARDIMRHRRIDRLAEAMSMEKRTPHEPEISLPDPQTIISSKPFPLSPIQQLHFSTHGCDGDSLDQQTLVLELMETEKSRTDYKRLLKETLRQLLSVHPLLRARFRVNETMQVEQTIADEDDGRNLRLRMHSDSETGYVIDCVGEAIRCINVSKGPLIAVDIFDGEDANLLVSMSIHHLVIDTVSWRIILGELEKSLQCGQPRLLTPEPVSFREWSCALAEEFGKQDSEACLGDMTDDLQHDGIPAQITSTDTWEMQGNSNTFNDIVVRTFELDTGRLAGLLASWGDTNFTLVDLLCAALFESFHAVFARLPQLYVEGHGREPFRDKFTDIGGVVGWFTTFAPLVLSEAQSPVPRERFRRVEEVSEARQGMELNGLARFSRQQLSGQFEKAGNVPMEITLNYLGSFQQVQHTAESDSMFHVHDKAQFQARLSAIKLEQRASSARYSLISAQFRQTKDTLCGEITWNKNMARQPELFAWASLFETVLVDFQSTLLNTLPLPPMDSFPEKRVHQSASYSVPMEMPVTIHTSRDTSARILAFAQDQFELCAKDIELIYPCSPIQESIMLSQLKPSQESALDVYEQQFLFEVIPPHTSNQIDTLRLHEAWMEIVQRHAIMRTIFVEDNAGFFQVVLRQHSPDVRVVLAQEVTATDTPGPEDMQKGHRLGHPLSGSVLHNLTIIEQPSGTGETRVFCTLTKSHLISCGYTSRLLIKDFLDTYDGLGGHSRGQYSDFIDYVYKQDVGEMTSWWAKFLDGASPCILPRTLRNSSGANRKTDVGDSSNSKFVRTGAAIKDIESLRLACRQHDLSSTSVICAAWGITLRTYMGNVDDVLFGLMYWGRDLPVARAHEILGPMINLLPARVHFKPGMAAVDVCQQFQGNYIEQLDRQTVPLGKIQNGVESLRGRGQIFNTIVNVQKAREVQHEQGPNRTRASLLSSHDTTEYDVALSVTDTENRMELSLEFRADFMSQAQAERLLQVFADLVANITKSPTSTINTLNVATPLDFAELREWNKTPLKPYRSSIHQMIRATSRAPRQAQRPAISSWDGHLTYWELEYLSSALASTMVAQGVKSRDVVALCFEKSLWAVVSMLAVVKAGAAFIQVHPDYPDERCKAILNQAKPTMGLASHNHEQRLSAVLTQGTVITVPWSDDCLAKIPADLQDTEIYSSQTDPSDVMYLISTSGTTGTPKLVVIEHQSFCSAVASNREKLHIASESRVLQFTDYCFDACLEEIFTVLVAGGCICVPSDTQRLSDMAAFIKQHNVNWAALTPSLMRTLRPEDIAPPVEFITVHAEPMTRALVETWAGRVQLRPSYGPSECSVTSVVGADFDPGADAANIGWPVGCHAWIVNPDNHDVLLPVGAVGELVLQGPIVGRGYLDDDLKTAAAFISPPAWASDFLEEDLTSDPKLASRMYKTGDLVRYDPEDGSLLIQARKDASQVKVRGQRIELREIEHHLDSIEEFQHGLAMVPRHGELSGRIVAVVSVVLPDARGQSKRDTDRASRIRVVGLKDLSKFDTEKVSQSIQRARQALARHLPRFMLPETWVVVERLPVTISHKLDRKQVIQWVETIDRLSLDSVHQLQIQDGYGTEIDTLGEEERRIRLVWGQVLGIDPASISIDQSFFQLGGNSLSAIDIKRQCTALGLQLSTQDVLNMPTVRQLAGLARQRLAVVPVGRQNPPQSTHKLDHKSLSADVKDTLYILGDNVESIMHCTPLQSRMYNAFHTKGRMAYVYNHLVKLDRLKADGCPLSEQSSRPEITGLLRSWQQTVERHSILRTIFVPSSSTAAGDGGVFQIVLKSTSPDSCVFNATSTDDVLKESRAHLRNFRKNLFKDHATPHSLAVFVDESDEGALYMHFILSHMLVDHVSLAHILSDFNLIYRGCPVDLMPPSRPFGDYIAQSTRLSLEDERVNSAERFWQTALQDVVPCILTSRHLSGSPGSISDVSRKDKPACSTDKSMAAVKFTLDITESVQSLCRDAEVTLSNLLQFVWAVLLHLLTENDAVCFGYLVSDRDRVGDDELEIVGPVLCLLVGHVTFLNTSGTLLDALRALQKHNIEGISRASSFDLTTVEQGLGTREQERSTMPGQAPVLFNTLINYRKVKYSSPRHAGHTMDYRSIWKEDPHEQGIVLSFNERPDGRLDAELSYFCGMFNDASMETLGMTFRQVLGILSVTRPDSMMDLKTALSSPQSS
ncbi:peptide synthetase [Diaporthe helianthi]|uniref:Peptide synthetase n=1 Tax=Diaporthe helianthi TaxID=158607 RepID=A0A2P5HUN9_DIAHE|nr:peptide synthetase [Diaporthe helianthi]